MAVKPIYAVGLDAGSRRTRIVICLLEGDRIRLLGCAAVESGGWLKGCIADQQAVSDSILAALREAEAAGGVSVESAVVGMGGPTLRGAASRGVVELGHLREIEQRDIHRVVDRALRRDLPEDCMVLQLFPQDFVVDDHPGHRDPRKMLAERLEINVHLVTASVQEHNSLLGAVNEAHLSVEETIFEAQAACYAAVWPEERREGVALIDIGAESTELVVYYGDSMYLASTLRICGDHFTSDLARGLCISPADAEMVKIEYGCSNAAECPEHLWVELPTPEGREPREARKRNVNMILESRASDLFARVRSELARVGMERALLGGIFMTGGGAKLPDLADMAEKELQCQSRFGLAVGIRDWPDTLRDPEWCTAAGLAMYSAKLKKHTERQKKEDGWIGKIMR
jgi:cell division protein FtsA